MVAGGDEGLGGFGYGLRMGVGGVGGGREVGREVCWRKRSFSR
jgi:hypothetical protein